MAQENNRKLCKAAQRGIMEGETGCRQLLGDLLKAGGDINFSEKPYYRTALAEAINWNQEQIAKLLIEKGADLNCQDYFGRSPLHDAAKYGYEKLSDLLIERKSNINQICNQGRSPLFMAVENKRDEIVKLLLKNKADPNITDQNGLTVGHMAAFQGQGSKQWYLYCIGSWKNRFELEGTASDSGTKKRGFSSGDRMSSVVCMDLTRDRVEKEIEDGTFGKTKESSAPVLKNQTTKPSAAMAGAGGEGEIGPD